MALALSAFAPDRDTTGSSGRQRWPDGLACGTPRWDRNRDLRRLLDFCPALADQPLVGGDQRHIRIDENPPILGRHLHVEMQVIGGRTLVLEVAADLAEFLALFEQAPAVDAVGVELPGRHVQIAKADMLI